MALLRTSNRPVHSHHLLTTTIYILLVLASMLHPMSTCGRSPTIGQNTKLTFMPKRASSKDKDLMKNGFMIHCQSDKVKWRDLRELSIQTYFLAYGEYHSVALSAERPYKSRERIIRWANPIFFRSGKVTLHHTMTRGKGRLLGVHVNSTNSAYFGIYRCVAMGYTVENNWHTDFSDRIYYYMNYDD